VLGTVAAQMRMAQALQNTVAYALQYLQEVMECVAHDDLQKTAARIAAMDEL
jgi:hypothetical protein